jgi:predicted MFS family arabinose efflux permease
MMGLVLAVSPAAGVYLGGAIVAGWGMHGVLTALALLAAVLLLLCCWLLPETRPPQHVHTAFLPLLRRMATDKRWRWRSCWWRPSTSVCSAITAWRRSSSRSCVRGA